MRKFFTFLAVVASTLATSSCQTDAISNDSSEPNITINEQLSPYAISEEQAISQLMTVLEEIDPATRSNTRRDIVSISSVDKSQVIQNDTRSVEVDIPEELLYIVSFGEGNGSAVLSADIRINPILAILDQTVLTPEDFANNETTRNSDDGFINEEDLKNHIVTSIENSAENQILGSTIPRPILPIYSEFETLITTIRHIPPMLDTKWNQGYPYNVAHPVTGEVMGCVPVAIAQFLYYHRWPASGNLYGEHFDWDLMENTEYGGNPTSEDYMEVSRFMYTIGERIGEYTTGTSVERLCEILSDLGITSSYIDFDIDTLSTIIETKGPVCMRGRNSSSNSGHAWVIDGWLIENRKFIEYQYNIIGTLIETNILEDYNEYRIHCNFGWGGLCDGYYSYTVLGFNTTQELPEEYIDTEYGDVGHSNGTPSYNFNSVFKMVQY